MEILGFISSVLVLISFLFNDIKIIRIINIIASIVFVVYGILISSFSIIFLNISLILINIIKIIKEEGNKNGRKAKKTN